MCGCVGVGGRVCHNLEKLVLCVKLNKLGCYSVQLDYSWERVVVDFFQGIGSLCQP